MAVILCVGLQVVVVATGMVCMAATMSPKPCSSTLWMSSSNVVLPLRSLESSSVPFGSLSVAYNCPI